MKTLTAAVTVAIVVTIMCILRSSAVPVVEEQLLVELMNTDNPAAEPEEISVNSWKMLHNGRQKRGIFCGTCCNGKVCWRCCYA
uniref:Hepcidin n=1 Tax=Pundamilia nyererei TaxID=303518 RepID=A0A3B4G3N5_9CICH